MTGGLDSSLTTRLILILARQAAQGQRMLRRICLDINFVSGQGQERPFNGPLDRGPEPSTRWHHTHFFALHGLRAYCVRNSCLDSTQVPCL